MGGSLEDRRSTTGYYFSLNQIGPPISWKSKKQATVALSSCEAEYMALAATTQEAMFLFMLIKDFMCSLTKPITINCDNQGDIALVKNCIVHNHSKHIDIKYHFIIDKFVMVYVPSESNDADLMTKPPTKHKLEVFHTMLFG